MWNVEAWEINKDSAEQIIFSQTVLKPRKVFVYKTDETQPREINKTFLLFTIFFYAVKQIERFHWGEENLTSPLRSSLEIKLFFSKFDLRLLLHEMKNQ